MSLWNKLQAWYDWKIYRLAYRSINRMIDREPGFAYLFQLEIEAWLKDRPLSPQLKSATEHFHESMRKGEPQ